MIKQTQKKLHPELKQSADEGCLLFLILYLQQKFFGGKKGQLAELIKVALVVRDDDITARSQSALVLQHVLVVLHWIVQCAVKLFSIARQNCCNHSGLAYQTIAFFLFPFTINFSIKSIRIFVSRKTFFIPRTPKCILFFHRPSLQPITKGHGQVLLSRLRWLTP